LSYNYSPNVKLVFGIIFQFSIDLLDLYVPDLIPQLLWAYKW